MGNGANVQSLEQLERFSGQVVHLRTQLLKEIETLSLELRRLTTWIEQEAFQYWSNELTQSQRRLIECQQTLSRCMSYVRADEQRPCTEEKKRVRRAEERTNLCQQKLRVARAAATQWERERTKANAKIMRCRDLAESDLVVAQHQLRDQIERLRAYANLRSAAFTESATGSAPDRNSSPQEAQAAPEAQDAPGHEAGETQ